MLRKLTVGLWLLLLFLVARGLLAQGPVITTGAPWPKTFSGAPTGTCGPQDTAVDTTTGNFYACNAGTWKLGGGLPAGCTSPGTGAINCSGAVRIGGGDPYIDVTAPPYNVDNTGVTDITTPVNNALAACGTGFPAGTVYFPPNPAGQVYALKGASALLFVNNHCRVVIDPRATIQVQSGFTGLRVFQIGGSTTDIRIEGKGVIDGGNIAQNGILWSTGSTRITIDGPEVKNMTGACIAFGASVISVPRIEMSLTNSFLHNCVGAAIAGFTDGIMKVNYNRIDTVGTSSGQPVIQSSGMYYDERLGNVITNSGNNQCAIYAYGDDRVNWQGNYTTNVPCAVHCDTCGSGTVSFNTSDNATGFLPDFFVEVSSFVTVEGNVSTNSGTVLTGGGLTIGTGGQSPATMRVQKQSFDSLTNITCGTNVTCTIDSGDKQEGTGSLQVVTNSSFTTGTLFSYSGLAAGAWFPFQEIWVKPVTSNAGDCDFQLVVSRSANIGTLDLVVCLPQTITGGWTRFPHLYGPSWQAALAGNQVSFGIRAAVSHPSYTIKFDDYTIGNEVIGNVVRSNKVNGFVSGVGISVGGAQSPVFEHNYVISNKTNQIAYGVDNTTGVVDFRDNASNFPPAGTGGTQHLEVTGNLVATTVTVSGDKTNAQFPYQLNAGGTLLGSPNSVPTISSGFGTGTSVPNNNGSAFFTVNVGTGGTATSGVIAMNATSPTGWACKAIDLTTTSATVFQTKQTATTTVTLGNFNTSGAAAAWVASDILQVNCNPY